VTQPAALHAQRLEEVELSEQRFEPFQFLVVDDEVLEQAPRVDLRET